MHSKPAAGAVAGLLAGVVFGALMQVMTAPTPEGREVPMMMMVAQVVRSESLAVGWLYHLFNSAVIGALFGVVFGARARTYGAGLGFGALWGVVWWVLGGLILMPILLGMPPFGALRMPAMRGVAMASLAGHLLYGLILGAVFVRLHVRAQTYSAAGARPA